jgi:2-polyprenyl-6-methoxyphenol hydroxylase-like FAD-dependent oxidoreductase
MRSSMSPSAAATSAAACVQSAPAPTDAAARMTEALAVVEGWQGGIIDCVRHTPTDTISRATIRDRWTAGAFGRGCVTLAGDAAHPMTPNLGQGGCTAIEDSVVLARTLAPLLSRTPGRDTDVAALAAALRAYERERSARCLPLTLRSWAFGAALQLPYAPVVAVRDAVIEHRFSPAEFLAHTAYDCGTLTMPR